MSTGSAAPAPPVYGLGCPDLAEARATLAHVLDPTELDRAWDRLLGEAGLRGGEQGPEPLRRLLEAMTRDGDVIGLCATSLTIRLQTYEKLSQVATIVRSAS